MKLLALSYASMTLILAQVAERILDYSLLKAPRPDSSHSVILWMPNSAADGIPTPPSYRIEILDPAPCVVPAGGATQHPNVVTISGLAVGSFELTESALFERLFPKDLAKVIQ